MLRDNFKKGMALSYQIFIVGVLVVSAIFAFTLWNIQRDVFSENIEIISEVITRDLSNIIRVVSTLEQGVYFYELPADTYEINVSPTKITVTNRNVNCEGGCGSTYSHNGKYVQASSVLLGTKRICIVKKYRNDNLPIVYLCDGEGKDLRCNCDIDKIYGVQEGERYEDENEPECTLNLTCLDNYGVPLKAGETPKEENSVKMIVEADNCKGMYLSPVGTPYKDWGFGSAAPPNENENEYTALRHKITKECLEQGYSLSSTSPDYCPALKEDKKNRNIRNTDPNPKKISIEYVCKGDIGDDFILDLVAYPSEEVLGKKYPFDEIAKIQSYVGCGEEPKQNVCTSGCYPPGDEKNKCKDSTKYYCDRPGAVYDDFCVPEYYDSNCHPIKNICEV